MTSWPAKDPDAVLDYVYRIPLNEGDSVADYDLAQLSGTVVVDSQSLAAAPNTTDKGYGQALTVWLSGGADEETSVYRISWVTAAGREDDDIITLLVAANELEDLVLTGYAKPSAGHLVARYPAFADVPTSTVRTWLIDAERFVDTSWGEGDYAAGLMALAAHNMALAGLGSDNAALSGVPGGVTRLKSASLEIGFTEAAANARLSGGYGSTRYGLEYETLLRRNRGGPLVMSTGTVPYDPYTRYPQGEA